MPVLNFTSMQYGVPRKLGDQDTSDNVETFFVITATQGEGELTAKAAATELIASQVLDAAIAMVGSPTVLLRGNLPTRILCTLADTIVVVGDTGAEIAEVGVYDPIEDVYYRYFSGGDGDMVGDIMPDPATEDGAELIGS